ncbi:hypothetical protein BJ875DRAFT_414974 [Amylocarpus encephaloides]|uniref:Rhodopsin domain-containing protein n=1 Tax=Amylocarpus encephaloides TaxID=45428 RepID=A0A9P8C9P4_9HELO|nr:hypothetical protein BJ875DRAFT_414974 [Amylocarpus encephaloides]
MNTANDGRDHGNIQGYALAVVLGFPILATLAVMLRMYSRSITSTFCPEDWLIVVAAVLYWGETYTSWMLCKVAYLGWHEWDIPKGKPDEKLHKQYAYATIIMYNPILALVRMSILLFLWRLRGNKRNVKRAIIVIGVINLGVMISRFMVTMLRCVPIPAIWDPEAQKHAFCINWRVFFTSAGIIGIIMDGLVLILPTWIVYDLQIQRKQKILLICILSFGLVTLVTGIVRIYLLDDQKRRPKQDSTYTIVFTTSTVEIGLAFVAACAPYFKAILVKHFPSIFGSTRGALDNSRPSRKDYELSEKSRWMRTQTFKSSRNTRQSDGDDGNAKRLITKTETITVTSELREPGEKSARSVERMV